MARGMALPVTAGGYGPTFHSSSSESVNISSASFCPDISGTRTGCSNVSCQYKASAPGTPWITAEAVPSNVVPASPVAASTVRTSIVSTVSNGARQLPGAENASATPHTEKYPKLPAASGGVASVIAHALDWERVPSVTYSGV